VNCDGTGLITRTVTASNGLTTTQMDDFIITGAVAKYDARSTRFFLLRPCQTQREYRAPLSQAVCF
jgi:hypothetical protein